MPEPIKERIVAAIATKLATITTVNGYAVDVAAVIRPRRTGENAPAVDRCIRVVQGESEPHTADAYCDNPPPLGWRLPVQCDLILRTSDHETTPVDTLLNRFEASVHKALMVDPTWGGLALRTELGRTEYPEPDDMAEGLTVWLFVTYYVSEKDPWTSRP